MTTSIDSFRQYLRTRAGYLRKRGLLPEHEVYGPFFTYTPRKTDVTASITSTPTATVYIEIPVSGRLRVYPFYKDKGFVIGDNGLAGIQGLLTEETLSKAFSIATHGDDTRKPLTPPGRAMAALRNHLEELVSAVNDKFQAQAL